MKTYKLVGRTVVLFGVISSILALSTTLSTAVLVGPAGMVPANFEPEPLGGVQVDQLVANYTGADIQGTIISTVYSNDVSNPLGGLTFTYEVIANASSTEVVRRFTAGNFGAWQTDVSYDDVAVPGVAPTSIDRSLSGNVIGFEFTLPVVIFPGQNSALLVVQTDSPTYAEGIASVINASAETVPSLVPVAIPEPATFALVGLGALALVSLRKRS